MRRIVAPLLLSLTLATGGCAGTYEHVAGGMAMGAAAGAMTGFVCCNNPGDAGKGAVIGIILGAIGGLILDAVDPI